MLTATRRKVSTPRMAVVRIKNLFIEIVVDQRHGAHCPAERDGFARQFLANRESRLFFLRR